MRKIMIMCLMLVPLVCLAQTKTATYTGEKISLQKNSLNVKFLGQLQGKEKQAYQGMDIYGNYLLSLQNTGIATIYNFNGKKATKLSQFNLASYHKYNHCNVASFGVEYYDANDPMPVVYVSQCQKHSINGMKDVAYVERINPDLMSSILIQTIYYDDVNHNFGYALQWVVDTDNNLLYGYGNTIDNSNPANKHRVAKFRLPSIKDGVNGIVTLTDKDLLETYLLEDYYNKPFMPVGQGLFVHNGLLYMPTGFGKAEAPSYLYVWDLVGKYMHNILDLREATYSEIEDSSMYDGSLIIQSQAGLFKLIFD